MYLQNVDNMFQLEWYRALPGDVFHQNEVEQSKYNFEHSNTALLFDLFDKFESEARAVLDKNLPLPAFDYVLKCSHVFNLLDARGAISVTERTGYIARVRALARLCAIAYLKTREELGYPLLKSERGENYG